MKERALALACFLAIATPAVAQEVPQVLETQHAMVVSRQPLASQVGADVMRKGGNAVDASVAVAMALAVVLPQAGNIGGGGFMLFHRAEDRFSTVIDFRETAPAAAHRDMYLDAGGDVDNDRARIGHLSVGVPGSVAGLYLAWSKYGKQPWHSLLTPAIRLAEEGFAVNDELATALADKITRAKLERFPATAALLLPNGEPLQSGDRLVQPELAQTLRILSESGPLAFYEGDIADQIVREMEKHNGPVTRDDLMAYRAIEREPIRGSYRELEILASVPPPSSGGITLLQTLAMLEKYDLSNAERTSAATVHLLCEVLSRAFADRNNYLGDPAFVRVPMRGMLSPAYTEVRRGTISLDRATPANFVKPGPVWTYQSGAPPVPIPMETMEDSSKAGSGAGSMRESDNTTHFSIVDPKGNVVSLTTTLNGGFGSGVMVEGAGFLLNNEMDDFVAKPGAPNMFGLVGNETNAIEPGKRMLSSMSPTIVLRDGRPWLVLGARGGPRIITAVLHILLNVYEFDLPLVEAVAAGRTHHQWLPDRIAHEKDALSGDTMERLQRMGHTLYELGPNKSSAQCIEIRPEGLLRGASDPRTQGAPAGY